MNWRDWTSGKIQFDYSILSDPLKGGGRLRPPTTLLNAFPDVRAWRYITYYLESDDILKVRSWNDILISAGYLTRETTAEDM